MNTNFEVRGSLNVKSKLLDPLVMSYNGDLVVLRYENSNAMFDIKTSGVKNDDIILTITMKNGEMTCTDKDGTNTPPLDTDSVKSRILSPFKNHTLVDIIRSEAEKYKAVMQ